MFRTKIERTPLTTDIANDYFANINGSSYGDDISFLATLRVLLYHRMSKEDGIYLRFGSSNYNAGYFTGEQRIPDLPFYENEDLNTIYIHSFIHPNKEANIAALNAYTNHYCGKADWTRIEKVSVFFQNKFSVVCFVNPTIRSVLLLCVGLNMSTMHYLQCAIPVFLPWYFSDEERKLTADEKSFLESLRETSPATYSQYIIDFAEKFDFRTEKIKDLLQGFEISREREMIANIKHSIEQCIESIRSYNQQINNYLRDKDDYETQLLGLVQKVEESQENELMDYFLANKNLELISVNDTVMKFVVKSYCEIYDEDEAKKIINNPNSYIYKPQGRFCNNYIEADDIKLLMSAVFIDKVIKIRLCAAYTLNIRGGCNGMDHYAFGLGYETYMPNPHIYYHACLGSNYEAINEIMIRRDYIQAIEQLVLSSQNLNFRDIVVMSEFMSDVYGLQQERGGNNNNRCFELPDGSVVNPSEAIEWLHSQNNQEVEENE